MTQPTPPPADPSPETPGVPPDDAPDDAVPSVRAVDLRDYVDFSTAAARRVRVHATGALAVDLWCIEPQQATEVLLYDDIDVAYAVLGGRSWFVTDEGEIGLDPLGSLLVPAGVAHGIDNRGTDPLIVLASQSPPGEQPQDAPVTTTGAAIRGEIGGIARAVRTMLGGRSA